MLSLLKKKSEANAAPAVPLWHPNFRNYEKLPDIKVVRTAFFVNGAAVSIALALAIYFGSQEWQLHVLHGQVADAQRQIDHDKKDSDLAVALFKKFQAEEAKINDVDAFVRSKPVVSELLLRLGQTLPGNIAIDSIDLRDTGLSLKLTVRGTPEAASSYANAYLEQLRADKDFARFDDFQMPNVDRNASTGRLAVDIFMRFRAPAKKP